MILPSLVAAALAAPAYPDSNEQKLGLTVGYWTQGLARPGVRVAAYESLGASEKKRSSILDGKDYTVTRAFLVAGGLGTFAHPGNELFVLADVQGGVWRTGRKGRHRETFVGLGYGRDFNAGPTYVLDEGELYRVPLDGRRSLVIDLSYGVGGQLEGPQAWYLRPTLLLRVPYAGAVGTTFMLEAGISTQVKR